MENNLKTYYRDCLFGALGAMLMLVGDLCLSVIPASQTDSGLFLREAYLNGSWGDWRLPLLLATGLCGMALGFFTVRALYMQINDSTVRHGLQSLSEESFILPLPVWCIFL